MREGGAAVVLDALAAGDDGAAAAGAGAGVRARGVGVRQLNCLLANQEPPRLHLWVRVPPPLPPPSRTNWTRLVPSSVLTGHVSSLLPRARRRVGSRRVAALRGTQASASRAISGGAVRVGCLEGGGKGAREGVYSRNTGRDNSRGGGAEG